MVIHQGRYGEGLKGPEGGLEHPLALGPAGKYFDVRDVVDQATKQKLILSIPVLSVPNGSGISPKEWAEDPKLMVKLVSRSISLFKPPLALPPMDLSVVPASYGLRRKFPDGQGQIQTYPSEFSIDAAAEMAAKLPEIDGTPLGVRLSALEMLHKKHPRQMLGDYVPGPFALATMLAKSDDVIMNSLYSEGPDGGSLVDPLLTACADRSVDAARLMVGKGAKVIAILDPTATQDILGPITYAKLLPFTTRLVDGIHNAGATAVLHVCGCTKDIVESMADSGADIISMDCRSKPTSEKVLATPQDIRNALKVVEKAGKGVRLMTGLQTPEIETMTVQQIKDSTKELIDIAREHPSSFIMSSTCEMPETVPVGHLQQHFRMVRAARL
ncbi:MAG: uroporphyrinogen decarboxylase family protein [Candidatus Altiarchaeota archaeon]|nr:uroporphyrinogen decarboxylase family protein [Candidatus Altiarchaeota archaeon]